MTLGASGMSQAKSGHARWHNGCPPLPEGPQLLELASPQGVALSSAYTPQSQGLSKPDAEHMVAGEEEADGGPGLSSLSPH